MAIRGYGIGPELVEALGLPKETNLIQIRIGLGEVAEVLCRYYPNADAMDKVVHLLQAYHLVPTGPPCVIDDTVEPLEPGAAHTGERPQAGRVMR